MRLPECLVWVMKEWDIDCTAVKIYCAEDLRVKVASRFTEEFNEEYKKVMELIVEEEGNCNETEKNIYPFKGAQITDYGVYLSFASLAIYTFWGDYLASHDAGEALEKALKKIKKEFSSIRYEGYVAYCWSDVRCGGVFQYEITSEKGAEDIVYDFVGEALAGVLRYDLAWDDLAKELEEEEADGNEFKKIIKLFHMYSQWVPTDAIDRIIDISEDIEEGLSDNLERFVKKLNSGKMKLGTKYLVSAKSAEAFDRIFNQWGDTYDKEDDCSFENYDTDAFGVMEKVIKVVHQMEVSGQKDEFTVVGKCESDYDCAIFVIEYAGAEPLIKASQADPEKNEDRYHQFCEANYKEIPNLLKRNKNRTFKQAIKDELPLGGLLNVSYEEWYNSILSK